MLPIPDLLFGELAALAAAFLWALASAVYAQLGQSLSPILLNIGKGAIAVVLLLFTLALGLEPMPDFPLLPLVELSCSGLIGIGIGDTLYFKTLQYLGVRRALLMGLLTPSVTAILALLILKEALSVWAWGGMALTLAGVAWVTQERPTGLNGQTQLQLGRGLGLGLWAVLMFAISALLSRHALASTTVTPLWSAFIRLGSGLVGLMVVAIFNPSQAWQGWHKLRHPTVFGQLVVAAVLGTYLGIWLQQMGFKYAPAGIAQTLLATSPLFILVLASIVGQSVSRRAWVGSAIAFMGVGVLLLFR
ncbi:MAG TPA: DMT family transporter [Stenomitos sp.]